MIPKEDKKRSSASMNKISGHRLRLDCLSGLRLAETKPVSPIRQLTASQEMPFGHFRQPQPGSLSAHYWQGKEVNPMG